jgi:hypothetical protein
MLTWEVLVVNEMCDDAINMSPFLIIYTIATRLQENLAFVFVFFCLIK